MMLLLNVRVHWEPVMSPVRRLCLCPVASAAQVPAAVRMSKQMLFFACTISRNSLKQLVNAPILFGFDNDQEDKGSVEKMIPNLAQEGRYVSHMNRLKIV